MTVVVLLIAVNVAVSLFAFRALQARDGRATATFLFVPHAVARGENALGMLLAHFAHASVAHLTFNMLALYSFAGGVVKAIGPAGFLLVYVVTGLGGDLFVYARRRDDPTYRCLGASGSVFGIVAAAVVIDPRTSVALFFVPVAIPGPFFLLAYGIVSAVLIARRRQGAISHEGHLGGAVLGLALAGVLAPRGLHPLIRWLAQWL